MKSALVKTGWALYQLLVNAAGPPLVAAASLKGRFGGRWRERLGLIGASRPDENPAFSSQILWFHAASVGEARSAAVVIKAFLEQKPDWEIRFSVGTPAGLATAEDIFKGENRVVIVAAPFDFWASAGRAMEAARPRALIIWETELWPNLISEAKRYGALVVLAAGRMTRRSFKRYLRVRHFMAYLLGLFDLIAPCGPYEQTMFLALGAPEKKTAVFGNPKFDRLASEADSDDFAKKTSTWRARLWADGQKNNPLIVAGSTHRGEEEIILAAFGRLKSTYPGLKLLLAPRHLGRCNEALELAAPFGALPASQAAAPLLENAEVLILDSLGQLNALYGLGDIALVGGSLASGLMGHNPLEPAAVARPVIFGPHMDSFQAEAEGLLKSGGARQTQPHDLPQALKTWLDDPDGARRAGLAARYYLESRPPVAPALAGAIAALIEQGGGI